MAGGSGGFSGCLTGCQVYGLTVLKALTDTQRGGIALGPDCDGLLNKCEESSPSAAKQGAGLTERDFDLEHLLASVQLPSSYPAAGRPEALVTAPKHYQLQVSLGARL